MAPGKQPALPARGGKKQQQGASTPGKAPQQQPSASAVLASGAQFITLADGTQERVGGCGLWVLGLWGVRAHEWRARGPIIIISSSARTASQRNATRHQQHREIFGGV